MWSTQKMEDTLGPKSCYVIIKTWQSLHFFYWLHKSQLIFKGQWLQMLKTNVHDTGPILDGI